MQRNVLCFNGLAVFLFAVSLVWCSCRQQKPTPLLYLIQSFRLQQPLELTAVLTLTQSKILEVCPLFNFFTLQSFLYCGEIAAYANKKFRNLLGSFTIFVFK